MRSLAKLSPLLATLLWCAGAFAQVAQGDPEAVPADGPASGQSAGSTDDFERFEAAEDVEDVAYGRRAGEGDGDAEDSGAEDEGAEDPWAPVERGTHQHDGFLFRVTLGLGYASFSEQLTSQTLRDAGAGGTQAVSLEQSVRGVALIFSLDLGYAIADFMALHVRLSEMSVPDPAVSAGGRPISGPGDATRAPTFIGPALTYYAMPWNAYTTAAFGLAVWRQPGFDGDTGLGDSGWGLNLDVGKEWWVHAQWGVGVAARLWWLTASGKDDESGDERQTDGYAAGALLSVTYQ